MKNIKLSHKITLANRYSFFIVWFIITVLLTLNRLKMSKVEKTIWRIKGRIIRKIVIIVFLIWIVKGVESHCIYGAKLVVETLNNKFGTFITQIKPKRPKNINDNFLRSFKIKASFWLNATHKYLSKERKTWSQADICTHTLIA